ncbi:putative cell surface polysaccharide export ABC-2 transporter permease protein, close relative to wzm1Y20833 [Pseudooceanicola batsensis HTCC2597]|uniref:Putative cell surface polysaccharide export ABC-2 transporter permease protein, close relative to wzm1Y20833 n=1 Tax=Pseudooceanicola batsensis (strain ATCC BAA-863 / DSM 15984 / KCTC 12145 / HTCC2597) TaxID=252305 RepID=A3TY56_PSEBH|nr:ABC transporter permease [Pseudooceanicola batsensis]EAQ03090.1 putative cell surface polysaccharide export ABC-2 transporter permease protein, close relative to wzm1Y20833 [Pseudooceanicola batsensis HTCC2597]
MRRHTAPRAIAALVLREIATTYGRTPGGYLWAVLEPVAAVALLSVVFALAFDVPPLGRDFPLFYASGYLPFVFYGDLGQKVGVALRYSRPLMAYPAVSWIDAVLARFLLNALTHILVAALVLGTMILLAGAPPPDGLRVAAGMGLAAATGLGFGMLNAYLFERWPVWERAWAILNRPAFIVSGVLFLPDAVPPPFDDLVWLNPLAHSISLVRTGLYPGYAPGGLDPLYALFPPLIALVLGLLLLRRDARMLLCRT